MLTQVLHEIQNTRGPITIRELSRKLEIDPQALEGMLQFWIRKGRLQNDDDTLACNSGSGTCGSTCSGSASCAFIAKMPTTYSIRVVNVSQNSDGPS